LILKRKLRLRTLVVKEARVLPAPKWFRKIQQRQREAKGEQNYNIQKEEQG
jgi:hypothetical protein